ncbi:MAG: glycosyltransferase [Christensenellaceae bacterium]|nr:glycosyltransferase [Christensenellaceae bacterium]
MQCDKWQSLCNNCPQSKIGYPRNYIFDFSTRNYRHKKACFTSLDNVTLVPPSQWLGDLLKQSFLKDYKVKVIYNGVDKTVFKPTDATNLVKKYNLEGKHVLLGIANDWDKRKGLEYILELNKRLDDSFVFALIGLSKDQIESMPKNIIALERTSSTKELAQWYSLASLLVNPTLEDNMPLVNLEAFACGTPVAVFATGGCVEVVNDDVGKVVDKGDVDALEQAILSIAPNKSNYMLKCLEHSNNFDKNNCYANYIKLYEELSK